MIKMQIFNFVSELDVMGYIISNVVFKIWEINFQDQIINVL